MRTRILGALVLLLGIVSTGLVLERGERISAAVARLRPLPPPAPVAGEPTWVPFRARYRSLHHGETRVSGATFRDSSGSMRFERTHWAGPSKITINNRVTRMIYARSDGGEWVEMVMPANMANTMPTIANRAPGLSLQSEVFLGETVHRLVTPTSDELLAPSLNFFPLRKATADMLEEHFDVQPGTQAAHLFEPPAGATVRRVTSFKELEHSVRTTRR